MKLMTILLLISTLGGTAMAQTRTVDGKAIGKYYNDVWKQWSKQPVVVYVDDAQNVYIRGGESLLKAVGYVPGRRLKDVIALLEKSAEWSKKARENQMEITKPLGSFIIGTQYEKQGIELVFFAANKGEQTDVILKIQDFDNMFSKIDLYLEPEQVSKLVALLKKVPATYRELKAQKAKSEILK
jgi:hypothetical protein